MLYGRPEAIVQAIIKKIRSLPFPNIEKLETVVNFALTVENLVSTIQACEVNDFVYNASLRYELVERLPSTLKLDWAKYSRNNTDTKPSRLQQMALFHRRRSIRTYAFLDDGSELTLMEQGLADELGVKGPTKSLCLKWTGGTRRTEIMSQKVGLEVSSVNNSTAKYTLSGVQTIESLQLRSQTLLAANLQEKYEHLSNLPIESYYNVSPRILIGLDHANLAHALKSREGKLHEPIAVKTRLGWVVYGSCSEDRQPDYFVNYHSLNKCQCREGLDEDLHRTMKEYFSLDSLGIIRTEKPLLSNDEQRASNMLDTLTRQKDGRFESGLLWKYDNIRLPDSKEMALRRWECLDRRMQRDPILTNTLNSKITDYVEKGYIRKLSQDELKAPHSRTWYLPVFPVVNPNKPGKTRLVWDAAATVHGISLNSVLLKGPDQLVSLLSVLVQFREFRTAITGDIREMYHQVLMKEDDQHCQRFFWRENKTDTNPSIYVMQVMTFGACCSPSTAQYVKNRNALRFQQYHPAAVQAITKRHYVDDMLVSVESEEDAISLARDVKMIHNAAGFEMRNWISNSQAVLSALNEATTNEKDLSVGEDTTTEKVLGMWWNTSSDSFTYKISPRFDRDLLTGRRRPTKREVLRTLMLMFDPLGLIAHMLMFLKMLLQDIWRSSISWDDAIQDEHFEKWSTWLSVLPLIEQIDIPRCYRTLTPTGDDTDVQLHTFVDASENGFAAAVYLRYEHKGVIECALVAAKTRVAPLKFLTIPRSELQAAILGVRLADTAIKSLSITVKRRYFWTDSRDVLCWLHSDHRRYSQFVAARISEILETTNVHEWRWVPTKLNVADEGTKWKKQPDLRPSSRWFRGPDFLWMFEAEWPAIPRNVGSTPEEIRPHLLVHSVETEPIITIENFFQWMPLLRRMAYVF
ncbi:uncharacterized protein LOC131687632 [Topomyia yanbarensis]|uniref:uncharacterized protein LOC131687632 n=1 Tax=Topomyia yanbarensis TaxID=2498891 RepID=UPI00273C307F|nr:uncharacterized protein LOC131687632 [Topomyia yanbarensis]